MIKRVILDVDTGIDDMVATIMAAKSESLKIEGVIATAGNQPLTKTMNNTLSVCQQLQLDVPVFAGAAAPLVKKPHCAPHIHGEDGLGGVVFPPLEKKGETLHGVLFLIETIRANPHEITVIATGPLTDIALAFSIAPDIIGLIDSLVIMGGALKGGNVTTHAEFNFFYDGEAAQIVLSSGAPVVLVPLDVTSRVRISEDRLKRYEQVENQVIRMMCTSLRFYQKAYAHNGLEDPIIHDAVCIAYAIDPRMFSGNLMDVSVTCSYDEWYGNLKAADSINSSVFVTTGIDTARFFRLFDDLLL
ncbi:MAG: nucleoside hydrolase [Sphaerochaetaceae bacterium]